MVALLNLLHFSSKLFRFARRFDQESDRHTMRFQLNRCKIYLNLKDWNGRSLKLIELFQFSGVYGKVFHSRRRRSWCSSWITLTGPCSPWSSSLLFLSNKLISSDVFFFGLQNFLHAPIVLCYCALVFFSISVDLECFK